jgi:hypothetical protein
MLLDLFWCVKLLLVTVLLLKRLVQLFKVARFHGVAQGAGAAGCSSGCMHAHVHTPRLAHVQAFK